MKLSKPQIELLTHAVAAGKASCYCGYPPSRKLIALKLATSHEGRMGGHWIEPTQRGIDALRGLSSLTQTEEG